MVGSPVDLTVSLNSSRFGSMMVPVLISRTARSRIGAFQVVGRDADRRVLEVQVQDVDASMLLSLSEVASVMTAGIKFTL